MLVNSPADRVLPTDSGRRTWVMELTLHGAGIVNIQQASNTGPKGQIIGDFVFEEIQNELASTHFYINNSAR